MKIYDVVIIKATEQIGVISSIIGKKVRVNLTDGGVLILHNKDVRLASSPFEIFKYIIYFIVSFSAIVALLIMVKS